MWKRTILILIPIAALLGPSLWHQRGDWWERVKDLLIPVTTSEAGQPSPPPPSGGSPTAATPGAANSSPAITAFEEVFRFDITPEWIINRFKPVTPGLSQLELAGYRVPLVTGTASDDLAGSLTYYFNARQQVQRITFQGTTGDALRLTRFLVANYRFTRRMTQNPLLVRYEVPKQSGPPDSALDIRLNVPDDRLRRYSVALLMERPSQ